MSTRHLTLALASLLALGCSTPKKQEVLNGPPANDPIRVVDAEPIGIEAQLSDDPAARRKELLASCYATTLLNEKAMTLGGRSHIALLSTTISNGRVTAGFSPPTHGSVDVFEKCVAKHIESGLFVVPEGGIFVSHAIEAARIDTREGEVTDITNLPLKTGAISNEDWASSDSRITDIVDECITVKLGSTKYPDFTILLAHEVPTSGEGGVVRVYTSWDRMPASFNDCVRLASELVTYSQTSDDSPRRVRHVITVEGN